MTLFSLRGKTVLITGGTGHLGTAFCHGLAEAGAAVALTSTTQAKADALATQLTAQYGTEARGYKLDLRDEESLRALPAQVVSDLGRLDGLVNNAYFGATAPLETMTTDEWRLGLDGASTSAFALMQACYPHLVKTEGSVVNVGSMYGLVSPDPGMYAGTGLGVNPANYGAGKAALLQLTRYAAVAWAERPVRVNAISPGTFPPPAIAQKAVLNERLRDKVPMKRTGRPEELQGALIFLLSDAASYVTGHNLVVDGGWTLW